MTGAAKKAEVLNVFLLKALHKQVNCNQIMNTINLNKKNGNTGHSPQDQLKDIQINEMY